jgi:plasmid stabilization system protein ParE
MPAATVNFHPAAAQEAESAYDWYAARDLSAAHAFREELRHAVDAVAHNPLTWPRHGRRARRYVFPRFPFSLVCKVMKWKSSPLLTAAPGLLAVPVLNGRRTSECSGRHFAPPLIRRVRRTSRMNQIGMPWKLSRPR